MANESIKTYQIFGTPVKIDIGLEEAAGIYGDVFWSSIESGVYEEPTFDFIKLASTRGYKGFLDIGAATGCMSLFAASINLKVVAVEPQDVVFNCLERNLSFNPTLSEKIQTSFTLVIEDSETVDAQSFFTPGASGPLNRDGLTKKSSTIGSLLRHFPEDAIVAVKIDIEGAEFPLFRDKKTLQSLQKCHALLLVALHPGFNSPLGLNPSWLKLAAWRAKATIQVLVFFLNVNSYAKMINPINERKINIFNLIPEIWKGQKEFRLEFDI